jgi:biopolymer transport protein TolQ
MQTDMSILGLIAEASLLVQLVMLVLVLASVISWAVMWRKFRLCRAVEVEADAFEQKFWSGTDLGKLYREISGEPHASHGLAAVFENGYRQFGKMRQSQVPNEILIDAINRNMRVQTNRETDRLELQLGLLATIGSVSPYIGLFGTVWGIMNSFRALGGVAQATMAMVAPGIAEALIATAMGLFAAIPAVIAYNRLTSRVDRFQGRMEDFQEEFVGLLQHQLHARSAS